MNRNSKIHNLIRTLQKHAVKIAMAESVTCGLAAHLLATCKGTSEVLRGSIVCYDASVKTTLLKVPPSLIEKHTAESRQVTERLAKELKKLIHADLYAAITGLASAGGSESRNKPAGTIFFTVIYKRKVFSSRKHFSGAPLVVREKACMHLYKLISSYVKELSSS